MQKIVSSKLLEETIRLRRGQNQCKSHQNRIGS